MNRLVRFPRLDLPAFCLPAAGSAALLVALVAGCGHSQPSQGPAGSAGGSGGQTRVGPLIQTAEGSPLGSLSWGMSPRTGRPWTAAELHWAVEQPGARRLARSLKRVLERAAETIDLPAPATDRIYAEHRLASDPLKKRSDAALAPLEALLYWSVCARADRTELRNRCEQRARETIADWVATYRPTGNPIDESRLIPLIRSIDLMQPLLEPRLRADSLAFLKALAAAGDSFYKGLSGWDSRRRNNWASWRLLIRALAYGITDDIDGIRDTQRMLTRHVRSAIDERTGESFDFKERDALHYHLYGLKPLLIAYLHVSELFDDGSRARLLKAFELIRPFCEGSARHVEFAKTRVPFDVERRDAGEPDFLNKPWEPAKARPILKLARTVIPRLRDWAARCGDLDGDRFGPDDKLLAALFGEDRIAPPPAQAK